MALQRAVDTRALADLRRDLKKVAPQVRKELDRRLRKIATTAARDAAQEAPKLTGDLARGYRASVTQGRGVAVVNRKVHAGPHEGGAQLWLRRGKAYRAAKLPPPRVVSGRRGAIPVRTVRLPDGRVQNEARYLIRRGKYASRAVARNLDRSMTEINRACRDAADRALS